MTRDFDYWMAVISARLTELIRRRRDAEGRDFNISAIAEEVGVERPYIYQIASGKENPSFRVLCKLANALGVDLREDLMTGPATGLRKPKPAGKGRKK